MKSHTRSAVAYIAGRIISKIDGGSIYDHSRAIYANIGGTIDEDSVQVYDYDLGCHISGDRNGFKCSLYHYGDGHHIDLNIKALYGSSVENRAE